MFCYKFRFLGIALGRFSQCFLNIFSSANPGGLHFYSVLTPPTPTIALLTAMVMVLCLRSPVWVCFYYTDETRKLSFSWTSQILGFVKKLLFLSESVLVFLLTGHVNFRKM